MLRKLQRLMFLIAFGGQESAPVTLCADALWSHHSIRHNWQSMWHSRSFLGNSGTELGKVGCNMGTQAGVINVLPSILWREGDMEGRN